MGRSGHCAYNDCACVGLIQFYYFTVEVKWRHDNPSFNDKYSSSKWTDNTFDLNYRISHVSFFFLINYSILTDEEEDENEDDDEDEGDDEEKEEYGRHFTSTVK